MYDTPFDSERYIDTYLTDKRAAELRLAARHREIEAAEILRHIERLNIEMVAREEGYRLARYFDSQRPPLLPAICASSIIATPTTKSALSHHETGKEGVLVSYAGRSVQVGETPLVAAIALAPPPVKASTTFGVNNRVEIPGYQGARRIERVEQTKAGTWFYAVRLLPDRDALTRFPAAVIDAYNRRDDVELAVAS